MATGARSVVAQAALAAVCLAASIGVTVFFGWPMYQRAQASLSWPTADGTVVSSELATRTVKLKKKYCPVVSYTYTVNGTERTSKNIWAMTGDYSSDREQQQAVLDNYPVGATVKVYYDPAQPDVAVLEPGVTSLVYVVLGACGAVFLAGISLAVATVTRGRQPTV